jgi:hypothetical protein
MCVYVCVCVCVCVQLFAHFCQVHGIKDTMTPLFTPTMTLMRKVE